MLKVLIFRAVCWFLSFFFVMINGMIRDQKQQQEDAKKMKKLYGEKRFTLITVYILILIPELVALGIISSDIKEIFRIGDKNIENK
jgi:hypothetical protein